MGSIFNFLWEYKYGQDFLNMLWPLHTFLLPLPVLNSTKIKGEKAFKFTELVIAFFQPYKDTNGRGMESNPPPSLKVLCPLLETSSEDPTSCCRCPRYDFFTKKNSFTLLAVLIKIIFNQTLDKRIVGYISIFAPFPPKAP